LEGKLKKNLLTSTALVAVGAVAFSGMALAQKASKPSISLSGWTEQIIGFADNDRPGNYSGSGNGFDQQTDSEIHFDGSTTLDNGINIRYRIELEGNTSGDQIDEHWMRISGSFGQITLGSQDGASQLMVTGYQGSWSAGVGQNLSFDVADWIVEPSGHAAGTVQRVSLDGDAEKISYYTPRFSGFQLGVSYVPQGQINEPGADDDLNGQPADRDASDHEGWQLGANYDGKFGDVGVGVAIGYASMEPADSALDTAKIWGAGARVDFSGFRIGVGYVDKTQELTTAGTDRDTTTWDFGIRYSFGPNAISLTYQDVTDDSGSPSTATTDSDETTKQAMLSFRRTLGPGVNWTLNGMWSDYEGRTIGANAGTDDNEGFALSTSIIVRF